jgi:hydrogenase maturation protease
MAGVLVAGIGNIFLGDDGFGVEVIKRLASEPIPEGVRVADYGIRGLHLAYDLLDGGYDTTVLVDATARGGPPGTVYLIEPDLAHGGDCRATPDPHGMHPEAVLTALASLGGTPGRVLVVGCEPASTEEGIGLSPAVEGAVPEAVRLVRELIQKAGAPVSASPAGG